MVIKKRVKIKKINDNKNRFISIAMFSILAIVIVVAFYLVYSQKEINLNPTQSMGIQNSKSIINAMGGKEACDYLTNRISTLTDKKGNTYGYKEKQELIILMGGTSNINTICSTYYSTATSSASPSSTGTPYSSPYSSPSSSYSY